MTHFKTTGQVSEQFDYKYKQPIYGKSTTDPTYYEPAATRIANMRKSAQSGKSLYDFEYDKDKKFTPEELLKQSDEMRITPGRKPGLTQEEIAQNLKNTESEVKQMSEDKKNEQKAFEDNVKYTKKTLEALSNSDKTSNSDNE